MLGPRPAILDRELDRAVNVEDNDEEQQAADDPKELPKLPEMLSVTVDSLWSEENLKVAQEMADDEQNHASHRHNDLPEDG